MAIFPAQPSLTLLQRYVRKNANSAFYKFSEILCMHCMIVILTVPFFSSHVSGFISKPQSNPLLCSISADSDDDWNMLRRLSKKISHGSCFCIHDEGDGMGLAGAGEMKVAGG